MRNTFDKDIHPVTEEDLVYGDEHEEIDSAEALRELIEKKEKFERRKRIKDLRK